MSEVSGISFIVAAYNLGDSLIRCIRSIQAQSLDQIEILIINDKSTDNTLDIATDLCATDPKNRTHCISHIQNLGLPSVRNTGLMAAQMKYIWHVDGDDFLPGKDVALRLFQSIEELGLLAIKFPVFQLSESQDFDEDCYEKLLSDYNCEVSPIPAIEKQFGCGGAFSLIYDRQFALSLNIVNLEGVNIGEDQILVSQFFKKLPCIGLVNIPLYVYDKTGISMMRKPWSLEKFLEERLYIHFISRLHRNSSWRLNSVAHSRINYLRVNLSKRAELNLSSIEADFLRACWSIDHNLLDTIGNISKHPNPNSQTFLDDYILQKPSNDLSGMFDKLFCDTEFVVYCGAHKTATTYLQSCLNNHRYELALNGVIYIDYQEFRREILSGILQGTLNEKSFKSKFVSLVLPLLFRLPKRVIIFDENLIGAGAGFWGDEAAAYKIFSCHKEGFNIGPLRTLLLFLKVENISLIYCIRDLKDYLQSRYTEAIKWQSFLKFKDYMGPLINNPSDVSWEFVCDELKYLCKSLDLDKPTIACFEQIKNDFPAFLRFVAGCSVDSDFNNLTSSDFVLPDSLRRSSPTIEAIDLSFQAIDEIGREPAQRLYKKLVIDNYGSSKYLPLSEDVYSEFCSLLDNIYASTKTSLITYSPAPSGVPVNSGVMPIKNSFEFLSDPVSPFEKAFNCVNENPSDDSASSSCSPLWHSLICFDYYKNREGYADFEFKRIHYGFSRVKGVSAMLRVKNEEINIQSVLMSCLKVFDEIIVIDNNSHDQTLSIVSEVRGMNPSYAQKIKVHSYPFDVARCGQENYDCPEDSVHSLAYFYNYCLSFCSFSHVFKWDGDMILPDSMVDGLRSFKKNIFENSYLPLSSNTTLYQPSGITVFKGHNGKYYFKPGEFEAEVRLFENRSDLRFVKDILWERLYAPNTARVIQSDGPVFVEFKDVSQDEFAHWKLGGLGMGPRKRRELENFKQVSQFTCQGKNPAPDELMAYGFQEYLEPLK